MTCSLSHSHTYLTQPDYHGGLSNKGDDDNDDDSNNGIKWPFPSSSPSVRSP